MPFIFLFPAFLYFPLIAFQIAMEEGFVPQKPKLVLIHGGKDRAA